MKVSFCTLGCKVNQYDTDAMRELFINAGHKVLGFACAKDFYRRLDDVLREIRQANAEAAATKVRRGLWKKRR